MRIDVREDFFTETKKNFVDAGELKASLFTYSTGVKAIMLENNTGYITILPYMGQMIWDAVFGGRSLKMKNSFREPRHAKHFLETYGCYLMHCGVLAMGCPSPEDTHVHHGELTIAKYDSTQIVTGKDERGKYIGVLGSLEYNRAFGDHYMVNPFVRLYEGSSILGIDFVCKNLSAYDMDFMYMCHINNRSVSGGRIVQSHPWTSETMLIRKTVPQYNEINQSFLDLQDAIEKDVKLTQNITEETVYDPEIVMFLRAPVTDKDGFAHFMYVNPDGSADYTAYKPKELPCCVRWMVKHKNWESMGLVLPGTAEPEGYLEEKRKGNVKVIQGHGEYSISIKTGYLPKEQVAEEERIIEDIMK